MSTMAAPGFDLTPDLTRYGLNIGDIQDTLATAVGGKEAGTLFEGDRRFDIVVRLPEDVRTDLEAVRRLPIALKGGDGGGARCAKR